MKILTIMILPFFLLQWLSHVNIFPTLSSHSLAIETKKKSNVHYLRKMKKAKYKYIKIQNIQKMFEQKTGNKNQKSNLIIIINTLA